MTKRIGIGYDVHRLVPGDFIVVGGVKIPHYYTCLAHSDGDVLLHSICDALLGAAGLGDIGKYFPNNDESYKGISSLILLEKTNYLLLENNYKIINIDSTFIAEKPKILSYVEEMKNNIAKILKIQKSEINIKATTSEKVGFIGREEGIASMAVVLIESMK
jgi:2-C-methyl-D-erythritol 2,4-cyclodiphosphate synthase